MARTPSIKTETSRFSYEQGLQDLESIVTTLEEGKLPLEEAFRLFEKGIKLTKKCQKTLDQVTQKVQLLCLDTETSEQATPFTLSED